MFKSFELLKKISFERIGGSDNELKAAMIIKEEIEKNNVEAKIEDFTIDYADINEVSFEVLEPYSKKYEASGVMISSETELEAELEYVDSDLDASLLNVKGKIAILHQRITASIYEKLVKAGAIGFIASSGSLYDNLKDSDLEVNMLRENHYKHGKIPGWTMRIKDVQEIIEKNAKKVKAVLKQKEEKLTSRNVVTEIRGKSNSDEFICFTAHYDSVKFSTGAYDNGTGSVGIMDLFYYYLKNKPERTLKFIWCGSEEMGLLGSKAYCKAHEEELKKCLFVINLDMIGVVLGSDIAVCTTENALVNYIDYLGKEVGFPIRVKQGVYSSDSTPFADLGIPALSFARISPKGGLEIHSRKDIIKYINQKYIDKTIDFIKIFSSKMVNSKVFPVKREIPQNMKDEIDYYYLRKKRNN